jgi:hypothetical protein
VKYNVVKLEGNPRRGNTIARVNLIDVAKHLGSFGNSPFGQQITDQRVCKCRPYLSRSLP